LTDRLLLHVRGDIGGLAVYDDASEFTWNVYAGLGFKLSEKMTLVTGYRALDLDREEGDDLETDLTMAGPEIGLHIQF
jgi:opacity protein-like surface antigen